VKLFADEQPVAASTQLIDLDYVASIDALISGNVDVAITPATENGEHTITVPGIRLLSVAQAEAIAKTVPPRDFTRSSEEIQIRVQTRRGKVAE
jgi:hypothetical protein